MAWTSLLSRFLIRWPRVRAGLARSWRCWRRCRHAVMNRRDRVDWEQVYFYDPQRITLRFNEMFPKLYKMRTIGGVLDGDWDRPPHVRGWDENHSLFDSMREHFVEHKPWTRTSFYGEVVRAICEGKVLWGCRSELDFQNRLAGLDALFESIKQNGFRERKDVSQTDGDVMRWHEDDVTIAVARDGRIIFDDGRHRLSIAKLLGLTRIPVRIVLRHRAWIDFRRQLMARSLPRRLTHVDLQDLSVRTKDGTLETLYPHLPAPGSSVLDLNAELGFLCHELQERGYRCFAMEERPHERKLLESLRRAEGWRFEILTGSLFEPPEQSFAVAIAANLSPQLIQTERGREKLLQSLARLDVPLLFLGFLSVGAKTAEAFVRQIATHGQYDRYELIGSVSQSLYKLSRK